MKPAATIVMLAALSACSADPTPPDQDDLREAVNSALCAQDAAQRAEGLTDAIASAEAQPVNTVSDDARDMAQRIVQDGCA